LKLEKMTFWPKVPDDKFSLLSCKEILIQLKRHFDEQRLAKMVESKGLLSGED